MKHIDIEGGNPMISNMTFYKTYHKVSLFVVAFAGSFLSLNFQEAQAFEEKFLLQAMGQRNFSSSLITSAIDIARDLKDKTGCLHKSNIRPQEDKFVICDLNEVQPLESRCHLIDLKHSKVQASGPVSFGSGGTTDIPKEGSKQTGLGVYVTGEKIVKKKGNYYRHIIHHNGQLELQNIGPLFKTKSSGLPASTEGSPMISGSFAKTLKSESGNILWANHSPTKTYDNACGMKFSRLIYESDMSESQLAEHKAKQKNKPPQRGIASEPEESTLSNPPEN